MRFPCSVLCGFSQAPYPRLGYIVKTYTEGIVVQMKKAVVTVIGKDMVGILAKVSTKCSQLNVNVIEVTQSVLQDLFAMIMLVDMTNMSCPFAQFTAEMQETGKELGQTIHVMHEDIFNSMHRI